MTAFYILLTSYSYLYSFKSNSTLVDKIFNVIELLLKLSFNYNANNPFDVSGYL